MECRHCKRPGINGLHVPTINDPGIGRGGEGSPQRNRTNQASSPGGSPPESVPTWASQFLLSGVRPPGFPFQSFRSYRYVLQPASKRTQRAWIGSWKRINFIHRSHPAGIQRRGETGQPLSSSEGGTMESRPTPTGDNSVGWKRFTTSRILTEFGTRRTRFNELKTFTSISWTHLQKLTKSQLNTLYS